MSSFEEIELGQIVISKSGRDKLRPLIVVEKLDGEYLRLVDGKVRRVSKPKLKKFRHVKATRTVSEEVKSKITSGKKLMDEEIRKVLEQYLSGTNS